MLTTQILIVLKAHLQVTRHIQQRVTKYNFNQVQDLLFNNHCKVTFRSLTSNKIHEGTYHIPKKFQSFGNKILVSNFHTGEYEDIEISTIENIVKVEV